MIKLLIFVEELTNITCTNYKASKLYFQSRKWNKKIAIQKSGLWPCCCGIKTIWELFVEEHVNIICTKLHIICIFIWGNDFFFRILSNQKQELYIFYLDMSASRQNEESLLKAAHISLVLSYKSFFFVKKKNIDLHHFALIWLIKRLVKRNISLEFYKPLDPNSNNSKKYTLLQRWKSSLLKKKEENPLFCIRIS
jgi:hypothetical protein